ncbi:MAG: hypothetical protein HPY60_01215 [Candidatus Methanofastidiosum sp.]|nr:hypothetical protein [Methanofastidiosum sp.]
MKKTIAIVLMFVMLGSIFVFAVSSQFPVQQLSFEQILTYQPPGGTSGCTNSRLLYEGSGVIPLQETDSSTQQFTHAVSVVVNNNPAVHMWGEIPIKQGCNYRVEACGTSVGNPGDHADVRLGLLYPEVEQLFEFPVDVGEVKGTECASFYWNPHYGYPIGVKIYWEDDDAVGEPSLQYNFKIYEECPCSLPPLYPKVDIEQFTVTGGSTIIRDGKILSSFEISPGTQQTFIQVENRGFFTQNEAMIKFMGLPNGVTVNITPEAQKIKAHNLGTYSAIFTVDPNVPSGTYDVTIVAYSSTGTFDVIQFKFVVP